MDNTQLYKLPKFKQKYLPIEVGASLTQKKGEESVALVVSALNPFTERINYISIWANDALKEGTRYKIDSKIIHRLANQIVASFGKDAPKDDSLTNKPEVLE